MIKIENTHVDNIVRAVYSARNAMNSWDKSDSDWETNTLGKADLDLAKRLSKAGNDHAKYLRMINVTCDITAPLYWWKQFSTYRAGVVQNSTSTMHRLTHKPFGMSDFSFEHLYAPLQDLMPIINLLNMYRERYLETKNKNDWWQLIQLLPSSYNQRRTVQLNYQVLKSMYFARRNHKLDCWRTFCDWMLTLPSFKEVCVDVVDNS